ncbi:MAG: MBL fold metallo-hydrolase [Clostridia bacterium]|nr:MBL fold metallo-hydrolase [Clostridia bacterium]
MKIRKISDAYFDTNTYIVWDEKEAIIIDCGSDVQRIMDAVDATGVPLAAILITHGHFDHIMTTAQIKEMTGAPVYISVKDAPKTSDNIKNRGADFGVSAPAFEADRLVNDGDILEFCGKSFKVIDAPGHSEGSICYMADNHLFCGDVLFKGTIGRFEREDKPQMKASVKKLLELDEDTNVYPGHGDATTISFEKRYNPFADFGWEWE